MDFDFPVNWWPLFIFFLTSFIIPVCLYLWIDQEITHIKNKNNSLHNTLTNYTSNENEAISDLIIRLDSLEKQMNKLLKHKNPQ